ncbi:MAG: isocitrate lyase/phosphoenolpyruvate mutase family protein [Patescibacteria group bacterium]|nr:isocitrate lyase/phosphoenolpyruvate mutase family protein [Patescibacteria group bacterium]
MADQVSKAALFTELHVKGNPIIIYNAWDGGSAKTIASCGAKAIATGDHPVGFAHGFGEDDFDDFSFDIYLPTIHEIALRAGELPFSVDISNADGLVADGLKNRIRTVLEAGVVGINYEDRLLDSSSVQPIEEQIKRIQTIREAAEELNIPLFINARTDIFILADRTDHAGLLDEAVKRANAYKQAGANGYFTPGLLDIAVIKQLADSIELPLNILRLPGAPSTKELSQAGVARISYGPVPQMAMTAWLKEQATTALNCEV